MKVFCLALAGMIRNICVTIILTTVSLISERMTMRRLPDGSLTPKPGTVPPEAMDYMRLRESEGYHWGAIRTLMASVSQRVVFQMQDLLGLGNYARMNTPATSMGNWQWRVRPDAFSENLSEKLRKCTETYHRR